MRLSLGYPDPETEVQILRGENPIEKVERLKPLVKSQEILTAIDSIKSFYVSPEVAHLVVAIGQASRQHPKILLLHPMINDLIPSLKELARKIQGLREIHVACSPTEEVT